MSWYQTRPPSPSTSTVYGDVRVEARAVGRRERALDVVGDELDELRTGQVGGRGHQRCVSARPRTLQRVVSRPAGGPRRGACYVVPAGSFCGCGTIRMYGRG